MREDCKYFQRRIYVSGDEASFCALGLAPEAPWRCPLACPRYTRRVEHVPSRSSGPADPPLPPAAAALLSSAEEIIGALGPEIAAESRRREQEERRRRSWWARLQGRSSRRKP